jgi:hypothetical protein
VSFIPFADFTHDSVPHVPAVKGQLVALYATGSSAIQETAADIHKYKAAGAGVILIDQSPSLSVFKAGLADVADVENFAGTAASAAAAILARQAHGWQSTVYLSFSELQNVEAALGAAVDRSRVLFGVADYSWSQAEAEARLNANPHWAYVQYGDPASNPNTLVPGTNVTLRECNADIDIAQASWAAQFLPKPPPPPPPAQGPFRHAADGRQSLAEIAAARGTTEAHLRALSETAYPVALARRPLVAGTEYWTSNP